VHGWGKIVNGADAMAPAFMKMGYQHPVALIYFLTFVEFVGGLGIAVGLFTRFFAAMVTMEMAVITFAHYLPNGFSWLNRGYEFVTRWGLVNARHLVARRRTVFARQGHRPRALIQDQVIARSAACMRSVSRTEMPQWSMRPGGHVQSSAPPTR
jgi:hypothetical protein